MIVVITLIISLSGCVLRLESTGFSDGLNMGFKRKRRAKNDSFFFAQTNGNIDRAIGRAKYRQQVEEPAKEIE